MNELLNDGFYLVYVLGEATGRSFFMFPIGDITLDVLLGEPCFYLTIC